MSIISVVWSRLCVAKKNVGSQEVQTCSQVEKELCPLLIDIDDKFCPRFCSHKVRQKCGAEEEGPEVSWYEEVAVGNLICIQGCCYFLSN